MAPVPRYWYYETYTPGLDLEALPVEVVVPRPLVIFDKTTGEINGEAVLMSALPSPRFRGFDGKAVILPHWGAQRLENAESIFLAFCIAQDDVLHNLSQKGRLRTHVRVQEVYSPDDSVLGVWECFVFFTCSFRRSHFRVSKFKAKIYGADAPPPLLIEAEQITSPATSGAPLSCFADCKNDQSEANLLDLI